MNKNEHGSNCKNDHDDRDRLLEEDTYFYYYGRNQEYHGMSDAESLVVGLLLLGFGIIVLLVMYL